MTRKPTDYTHMDVCIGVIWLLSFALLVALAIVRLGWT